MSHLCTIPNGYKKELGINVSSNKLSLSCHSMSYKYIPNSLYLETNLLTFKMCIFSF